MTEQKHTPLPWVVNEMDDTFIETTSGKGICEIPSNGCYDYSELDHNAKFIVRACNSHYDLVEALEMIVDYLDSDLTTAECYILEKTKQALAKAKG